MSSERHLLLSSFIKKIHKDLRTNSETLGVDRAWKEHCKNESALKEYAQCMKLLATQHWDKKHKEDAKNSRNAWIVHQINDYFLNKIYLARRKKEATEKEMNCLTCPVKTSDFQEPYSLLDVGSCYNPFKDVVNFVTTAIDICPATDDVFKCDFLNLSTLDPIKDDVQPREPKSCRDNIQMENLDLPSETDPENLLGELGEPKRKHVPCIKSIHCESFDVVVFSLLLEYIPCSKLRFQCCVKAYHILKHEGILIIITPDSKHQTSPNVQIMKKWKLTLQEIGFKRIKYEKLTHIHCMIFRKSSLVPEINDVLLSQGELAIPQDFNKNSSENNENDKRSNDSDTRPESQCVSINDSGTKAESQCVSNDFMSLPSDH
uniref:S-adenosylmethionine sensor upstream of mTORC1 n=1 Tax=Cacopsylla melanoneura TaxID=428564 RepID=A0A8D8PVU1_9HEMI